MARRELAGEFKVFSLPQDVLVIRMSHGHALRVVRSHSKCCLLSSPLKLVHVCVNGFCIISEHYNPLYNRETQLHYQELFSFISNLYMIVQFTDETIVEVTTEIRILLHLYIEIMLPV